MNKFLITVGFLLLAGLSFAADVTPLTYGFPVMGTPVDNTVKYTFTDNVALSLQAIADNTGITWTQNGQSPHGVWVSVETQDARFGTTGISAASTTGHLFVKSTVPIHFSGAGFLRALKFAPAAAGAYPVLQITLER